jgi:hypothetical protein
MQTTQQNHIDRNLEWASRYDLHIYRSRKAKHSPVQKFLFWSAMVIIIGIVSARLALLIV